MASLQSMATRTSCPVAPSASRRPLSSIGVKRAACAPPNLPKTERRWKSFIVHAAGGDTLRPGESLEAASNGTLYSKNGRYRLVQQQDGNLVLYDGPTESNPVWQNGQYGSGAVRSTMQNDGNFVSYTADGTAVWSTNTYDNDRFCSIVLQDDRNLVIYKPIWASNTYSP